MSVIDDLKRLERAGQENSATNKKLCKAAVQAIWTVINAVEQVGPGFPLPDEEPLELPRGYRMQEADVTLLSEDHLEYEPPETDGGHILKLHVWGPCFSFWVGSGEFEDDLCLSEARALAKDVATGWLAEVATWIEEHTRENGEFLKAIESAELEVATRERK